MHRARDLKTSETPMCGRKVVYDARLYNLIDTPSPPLLLLPSKVGTRNYWHTTKHSHPHTNLHIHVSKKWNSTKVRNVPLALRSILLPIR